MCWLRAHTQCTHVKYLYLCVLEGTTKLPPVLSCTAAFAPACACCAAGSRHHVQAAPHQHLPLHGRVPGATLPAHGATLPLCCCCWLAVPWLTDGEAKTQQPLIHTCTIDHLYHVPLHVLQEYCARKSVDSLLAQGLRDAKVSRSLQPASARCCLPGLGTGCRACMWWCLQKAQACLPSDGSVHMPAPLHGKCGKLMYAHRCVPLSHVCVQAAKQLSWPRLLSMASDAAKGMVYLHSRQPAVYHRDLKSANLLVTSQWQVKVCCGSECSRHSLLPASAGASGPSRVWPLRCTCMHELTCVDTCAAATGVAVSRSCQSCVLICSPRPAFFLFCVCASSP